MLFLAGCASTTRFAVDARHFAESPVPTLSYRLNYTDPAWSPSSPSPEITTGLLDAALSGKGLYEAPRGTKADLVIDVMFGMMPAETRTVMTTDPFSQPGSWPTSHVFSIDPLTGDRPVLLDSAGNIATLSTTVIRRKFLRICAWSAAKSTPPTKLWSVDVENADESDALAVYLPLMIAAAMDSLQPGADTHSVIDLGSHEERVTFLQRKTQAPQSSMNRAGSNPR